MPLALVLKSGIRIGSAGVLHVKDLDLNAGEVTRRCKGDRVERVFLGAEIADHLRKWIGDRTGGPLFATKDGRRITARQVARRFGQWIGKADIKRAASPHTLRHTFAKAVYQRTGDLLLTKAALGHRSIASTLVYARVDQDRLRAALA